MLERFLVDSSRLVTTIAERRDDLAGLIGNLNTTTRALGDQKVGAGGVDRAAAAVHAPRQHDLREPARRAQRRRPAGQRLQAGGPEARPVPQRGPRARRTTPGRRCATCPRRSASRGRSNDLIDFLQPRPAAGRHRRGHQEAQRTRRAATTSASATPAAPSRRPRRRCPRAPPSSASRGPYTTDFLGWLDDFSTTGGGFDALGAMGARPHLPGGELRVSNGDGAPVVEAARCASTSTSAARAAPRPRRPTAPTCSARTSRTALHCKDSDRSVGAVP